MFKHYLSFLLFRLFHSYKNHEIVNVYLFIRAKYISSASQINEDHKI